MSAAWALRVQLAIRLARASRALLDGRRDLADALAVTRNTCHDAIRDAETVGRSPALGE